jgi:hypothetical protein
MKDSPQSRGERGDASSKKSGEQDRKRVGCMSPRHDSLPALCVLLLRRT